MALRNSKEAGALPKDQKRFDKVIQKAVKDPKFRAKLKAEPVATLRKEGVDVPVGVEVRVRDFDEKCRYLFLPPIEKPQ